MSRSATVAGTAFENRAEIIRCHCQVGMAALLKSEPDNAYDDNAIAVYLVVPRLFGLLGTAHKKVGFIKAKTAISLAKRMDAGQDVGATVKSFYAPKDRRVPRITLALDI